MLSFDQQLIEDFEDELKHSYDDVTGEGVQSVFKVSSKAKYQRAIMPARSILSNKVIVGIQRFALRTFYLVVQ